MQALLQPAELGSSSETFQSTFEAAEKCDLIVLNEKKVILQVEPSQVESVAAFQAFMRSKLLGVTNDTSPNYLLNLFCAWYAVQNEGIFSRDSKQYENEFLAQIFPNEDSRGFNTTKFNGWRNWAVFVGWGWLLNTGGNRQVFVPDARDRVHSLLPQLLPEVGRRVEFGSFLSRLAQHCPELDNGRLFEYCWQASRGQEERDNRLSLMLSSGLRVLANQRIIKMTRIADTSQDWELFPAQGYELKQVTHIELLPQN